MRYSIQPTSEGSIRVDESKIAWARWGEPSPSPVVLIHGAGAQMGWWDGVIAELVPDVPVAALDLSGHGNSDWREHYSGETWASEVTAVAELAGGGPLILVGHSLGGRVAIMAASRSPALAHELVLVDSPGDLRHGSARPKPRAARRHPSLDAAIDAFRLQPPDTIDNQELLRRVAADSYQPVDGGWQLKGDRNVFRRISDDLVRRHLAATEVPITEIWGEHSPVVTEDVLKLVADTHPGRTEFVALPGGHHLLFDHAPEIASVIASRWTALVDGT